jgi:hypothetical protein
MGGRNSKKTSEFVTATNSMDRTLVEKVSLAQQIKKLSKFYTTTKVTTVLTNVRH